MIDLASLDVYNSIFNVTEENNKFKFYTFPDTKVGGITYEKVGLDVEKVLEFSDITATH